MPVIDVAVDFAIQTAGDNAHGYDQANRWGPDYDCSSLVITAFKRAGVPLTCTYTGNMRADMLSKGFVAVNDGTLRRGDVLLNDKKHTALYVGEGYIAQASINENGGLTGGEPGDQTGREINIVPYYNFPWDVILRYTAEDADPADTAPFTPEKLRDLPYLRPGCVGADVKALQHMLILRGVKLPQYGADGAYGAETKAAVETFQRLKGISVDGECYLETWGELAK